MGTGLRDTSRGNHSPRRERQCDSSHQGDGLSLSGRGEAGGGKREGGRGKGKRNQDTGKGQLRFPPTSSASPLRTSRLRPPASLFPLPPSPFPLPSLPLQHGANSGN